MKHGTRFAYSVKGCRCDLCAAAYDSYKAKARERKRQQNFAAIPHGTREGYNRHRCRCDSCLEWKRDFDSGIKTQDDDSHLFAESPEERKRSNDAWRRRFEVEWGLA